ncbi:peptidoglycan-binding protein [Stigmatella sp. ncwal1]|uniref:Peptidoglycan-binding protein n=1 Tax=Stigmatella ashevillensis TaxID=2995309 RepID=A0ABT5DDR8_9BACT|nr:peptidoglycan-binding protein [Stigmatella ashevillena]MDC0711791.1 peptidoglycan-binding protein [Stigmatella ashevillena]
MSVSSSSNSNSNARNSASSSSSRNSVSSQENNTRSTVQNTQESSVKAGDKTAVGKKDVASTTKATQTRAAFDQSRFDATPAVNAKAQNLLTAPDFSLSDKLLSPTPMAEQDIPLQAPELSSEIPTLDSLGPAARFEPREGTLPAPVALDLTSPVGARGANVPSDVRKVQDRLHELGFLSDEAYTAEQADPAQTDAIPEAEMSQTIEAIRKFQGEVAGVATDGNVGLNGATAFSLRDPTYGTQSTFNPSAADSTAGVPVDTFGLAPEVEQIVEAIEAVETGDSVLGESPALLRNASGTPASFGKGQLVAGTAVGVLAQYPDVAEQYGLDATEVQDLNTLARQTTATYNDIRGQVPNGGLSEADLQTRIAEYTADHGAEFREQTGLKDADIENMFRAAQLSKQLPGVGNVDRAMENPDIAANVEALGLRETDVEKYIDNPDFHGEHRQGFVTRALFSSENGQALRDAMTDNGGIPLARGLIQDNYNTVVREGARTLGRPLTPAEAAEATMLVHNRGMGALSGLLASFNQPGRVQNPYVARAMEHWTPPQ